MANQNPTDSGIPREQQGLVLEHDPRQHSDNERDKNEERDVMPGIEETRSQMAQPELISGGEPLAEIAIFEDLGMGLGGVAGRVERQS